jgi:hypothetical protein
VKAWLVTWGPPLLFGLLVLLFFWRFDALEDPVCDPRVTQCE